MRKRKCQRYFRASHTKSLASLKGLQLRVYCTADERDVIDRGAGNRGSEPFFFACVKARKGREKKEKENSVMSYANPQRRETVVMSRRVKKNVFLKLLILKTSGPC